MQSRPAGTEDVFGIPVQSNGGMAELAKQLLTIHLVFIAVYFVTGAIQAYRALAESMPDAGGEGVSASADPMQEVFWAIAAVGVTIALFYVLRQAIQTNNDNTITGLLFCDGCCTGCNCFLGFCTILVVGHLFAAKAIMDSEDICECSSGTVGDPYLVCSNPCSACYGSEELKSCTDGVQHFTDNFGSIVASAILQAGLVCGEMVCCLYATVQLNQAKLRMRMTPFSSAAYLGGVPPVIPAGMYGGGMPGGGMQAGTVVVGQPVQGVVVTGQVVQPSNAK